MDYTNAVVNLSSTNVRDIQNLSKRKASVTSLFANSIVMMQTFGKFLNPILGIRCPLLICLHKYFITPLGKFRDNAQNQFSASRRVAVKAIISAEVKW